MIAALRRALLWLAIYHQRIQINTRLGVMELVRCPLTLGRMAIALHHDRRELARLQDAYNATLPVERRIYWSMT